MENKQEIITVEGENKVSLRTQEGLIAIANTYLKKNGDVILPPNYDVNDAVKALYLDLVQKKDKQGRPALEICTRESIENVVQQYVSRGLNVAKKQCNIIPFGNSLTMIEGYFGMQKEAKTYAGVRINSDVIYEGEHFNVNKRTDGVKIFDHKPDFSKFDTDKIIGAYAIAINDKGEIVDSDLMTMKEIKRSWGQSRSGGDVHKAFPVEMCRKTVIGRLAKKFVNTSDDSNKFEIVNSDIGDVEINADIVIEDEKSTIPTNTVRHEQAEVDMAVDELGEEQTKEILYKDFVNNKTKYRAVPNSYKEEEQEDGHIKKTIRVYCDKE